MPPLMSSLTHRGLRLAAFLGGLALGIGTAVFAYSNTVHVEVSWWRLHWTGVPLGLLALVPLLAGLVAGYLYHLPARMYHFREHMRHRGLVHHLEKENQELRHSLDQVLEMPETDVPARPLPARPVAVLSEPAAAADLMEAEPVVVHRVRQARRPADRSKAAPALLKKSAPPLERPSNRRPAKASKLGSSPAADPA